MPSQALVDQLRNRVVGELHIGHLRSGDRLPGVRELGKELDADHRAVAAAYRVLEGEGMVEVRGRTGVFVAKQERVGGQMPNETAEWLATVLTEARRRRVGLPDFPGFVRSSVARVPLRALCVESNEDSSTAICLELKEEFGVESVAVHAETFAAPGKRGKPDLSRLPRECREVHFLVTTGFHAHVVKPAADALGKPLVTTTVNAEMARIVERRLETGVPLTVIAVDAGFCDRLRQAYGNIAGPEMIRMVLATDDAAIARLDRTEPVLATRAARRALPDLDIPLLLPRFPSISLEATRELAATIIRLNLETPA